MILPLLVLMFSSLSFAQDKCQDLYKLRHESLKASELAFDCYEKTNETSPELKAYSLSKMSYLKFFMAEFQLDKKEEALLQGIELADRAILLFGPKYSVTAYNALTAPEKKVLAEALYHYGLTTARYIDIKGQWEAIKRMEDIKKSMNTIIRMKEEKTAFFGAHRTLGIFHIKVPYIAGGRIEIARNFLITALEQTQYKQDLSLYPANNVAYAELMFKENQDKDGCYHANLVASLATEEVAKMDNGLYLETLQSIKDAKSLIQLKKCATLF